MEVTLSLDVFGKGLEVRPLDPPGVCFICEASPEQDAIRVINTNRFLRTAGPTHLTGRKYVCEPCAQELGRAVDQVDGELLADAEREVEALRVTNAELEARVLDQAALEAVVERLAPKPKPAPKKKEAEEVAVA